uniref:Cilia and flagella associated protein 144 n=1 Tax=Sphenodon punctatus TaxID=8508 RepID=A0A8D0GSH2_SPHPU
MLHTEYELIPLRVHILTRKPMSWHDNVEEPADAKFLHLIRHAALEPTRKYTEPQTESQEIGWVTTPLGPDRHSRDHHRHSSRCSRDRCRRSRDHRLCLLQP